MTLTRRDLLKLLLASAVAEAVDVERLLWVPKPIVTVPALPPSSHYLTWSYSDLLSVDGELLSRSLTVPHRIDQGWL